MGLNISQTRGFFGGELLSRQRLPLGGIFGFATPPTTQIDAVEQRRKSSRNLGGIGDDMVGVDGRIQHEREQRRFEHGVSTLEQASALLGFAQVGFVISSHLCGTMVTDW